MQVSASIDGDASLVDDSGYDAKVRNGTAVYGRGALGVIYNLGAWHLNADLAPSMVMDAYGATLAFGATRDMN